MVYRDVAGQPLSQGDSVFFGSAFGQAIVGTIQKADSVLTADPNATPMIHVSFTLSLPALPNGLVGGVLKIVPPSTPVVGQAQKARYTPISNSFNTQPIWLDTDTSTGGNTNWRGSSGCTLAGIKTMGIKPTRILIVPATNAAVVATGTISVKDPQTNPATQGLLTIPIVTPAAATPFTPIEIWLENTAPLWRDFVVTGLTATVTAMQIWYRT